MKPIAHDELNKASEPAKEQRRLVDRRRHRRRFLSAPVRFMMDDKVEHQGVLYNISASGVCIRSDIQPDMNESLILYIDNIGRFEGKVVRREDAEFAIKMELSSAKINRLESSLENCFSKESGKGRLSDRRTGLADRRLHERINAASSQRVVGITEAGVTFQCSIKTISLGGIDIETSAHLDLGEYVTVGKLSGYVARKREDGYVILKQ